MINNNSLKNHEVDFDKKLKTIQSARQNRRVELHF